MSACLRKGEEKWFITRVGDEVLVIRELEPHEIFWLHKFRIFLERIVGFLSQQRELIRGFLQRGFFWKFTTVCPLWGLRRGIDWSAVLRLMVSRFFLPWARRVLKLPDLKARVSFFDLATAVEITIFLKPPKETSFEEAWKIISPEFLS